MPIKQEYQVKLALFEGPLDLLLYLVTKAEIDITEIRVADITHQYLEYLDVIKELNIDIAAEYLHMAATLIRLKAQELLPPDLREKLEGEEGIYNREQLIAQLLEYKKYKEAANSLKGFEAEQIGTFGRGSADKIEGPVQGEEQTFGDISMFDLIAAFKRILERASDETNAFKHIVITDDVKIDDCIEHILGFIEDFGEIPFEQLFAGDSRKLVLVVTFMALLECVKLQRVSFRQENTFGSIFVVKRIPDRERPAVVAVEPESEVASNEGEGVKAEEIIDNPQEDNSPKSAS